MEKSNQERLKDYLVGNDGYLKNNISNGKVIMLSGKWGSGKTFFWKELSNNEIIQFQEENQKAYVYCSLYGNTSIEKIEDNIYAQAYLCSVGGENIVLKGYQKVKDFGKRFGSFCSLFDVSKLLDGIDEIQQNNIKKSALLYLSNGGLICFDDFERKSKDIDLNDLFGLILHFAIDLDCKVVIILNDDVFEGEEKKIFSNVKEKSVSKFLKYKPGIKKLFETIFNSDEEYRKLDDYKEIILNTIEETEELNARIYIQVLDNLVEWIGKKQETNENVLRCLILVNINFILNHVVFKYEVEENDKVPDLFKSKNFSIDFLQKLRTNLEQPSDKKSNKQELFILDNLKKQLSDNSDKKLVDKNQKLIWTLWNYEINLKYKKNVADNIFQKINNFIETGILI